jgi:hypothetical protein
VFVEDTDRLEWCARGERLEPEGDVRLFRTSLDACDVVAVTFACRLALFGIGESDAAPRGDLRFRNPRHPAARTLALASAVMSSV